MPTENPKISAYVPQLVYDRFKQFQEEHNLSMSQAAIEIFAAYFGINLNPTVSSESIGELQSRLGSLEKALADLQESHFVLSKRVDSMQSTNELLIIEPVEVSVDNGIDSKLNSGSEDKPLQKNIIEQPIYTDVIDKLESSLNSEPPKQLQLIDSSDLLSKLKNNPLQGKLLVNRLNKVNTSTLSNKKSELSLEEFYDWLQSKDIDGIKWVTIGEGRKARFIPAADTPIEKLEKLGDWMQSNT
jgi:hypothetical protein